MNARPTLDAANALADEGRIWFRGALPERGLRALDAKAPTDCAPGARLSRTDIDETTLETVNALARELLPDAHPVRLVAFDKREAANWALPWHQDRVIALRARADVAGFTNWTRKTGVWHAEPPVGFLERMLFARVHLDSATDGNGALQIALGSHRFGKVSSRDANAKATACPVETCIAERGDVLFANLLVLHRSPASRASVGRRALRIDYCADKLPAPLEWEDKT